MQSDDSVRRTRASLLLRLRQGPDDAAAWREFVRLYGPLIYSWCRHWQVQPADAEDVTQEVLLTVADRLRTFTYDPDRRFRGFLRTIAQHAWSDLVQARRRAVPASGDSAVAAVLDSVPARDDLAARLEAAFDQELFDLACASVRERVEPHTWEAFRLTALEGCSGAEAGARLGMEVGTVFKAKSKVQKMLREAVERLESEGNACPSAPTGTNSTAS
jgi:RNA polymerase sigma-70 factor (ECF subfamily)